MLRLSVRFLPMGFELKSFVQKQLSPFIGAIQSGHLSDGVEPGLAIESLRPLIAGGGLQMKAAGTGCDGLLLRVA